MNRRQPYDGPKPLRGGIDRVLKHLHAPKVDVVQALFADWEGCVGELIAAHSRPVGVANGTLSIEVDEAAWASELAWMSGDLIERISTRLDTNEINEISVKITR